MSTAKRHIASLRDEYAEMTRQRIVAAFVETLEDEAADDISMAAVAKRAKVAERTIYRHFKTRAGRRVRAGFRRHLIDQHHKAMAPLVRHLAAKEVRQAEAVASYLNNVLAWNAMREDFGMSSAEIADAIEWALTTLLKDVRQRDAAAARSGKAGKSPRKRST